MHVILFSNDFFLNSFLWTVSEDIALLKSYGLGPYTASIKKTEKEIKEHQEKVTNYIFIEIQMFGTQQEPKTCGLSLLKWR